MIENPDGFEGFFEKATEFKHYPYQRRLAESDALPSLINIPTGAGKTVAVVLAWLWRRKFADETVRNATPRRLVYCLPMRVLVEQTRDNAKKWLENLGMLAEEPGDDRPLDGWAREHDHDRRGRRIAATVLMGGEDADEWDIYPERDAIIIGTQDMLLSRALNRGYGMSRYRWPMHFGLLNNDCLWVMDEVQLMGNGLATSVQIHLFHEKFWKSAIPCRFIWMSATLGEGLFNTRDRSDNDMDKMPADQIRSLLKKERDGIPAINAEKKVVLLEKEPKVYSPKTNEGILDKHQAGRLTLLIVNTVPQAQKWFQDIKEGIANLKEKSKGSQQSPEVVLLHGRMRPCDRKRHMAIVLDFVEKQKATGLVPSHPGLVVVATQVVEAGFDASADCLWSEVAPWSSVIQRLGRLNRAGKQPGAYAWFWPPKSQKEENEKDAPNAGRIGPYEKNALKDAESLLAGLIKDLKREGGMYCHALDAVLESVEGKKALHISHESIIRPQDFHELYFTEPDLAGGFTDISRYVRDADQDADVLVFWGDFVERPHNDMSYTRDILCNIPVYVLRSYLKTHKTVAWEWNPEILEYQPVKGDSICPGMTLLLQQKAGGYDEELGWTGDAKQKPTSGLAVPSEPEAFTDDRKSESTWLPLTKHLSDTQTEAEALVGHFNIHEHYKQAVLTAARWHDVGKIHPRWQGAIGLLHKRLLNKVRALPSKKAELKQRLEYLLTKEVPTVNILAKFPYWNKRIEKIIKEMHEESEESKLRVRFDPSLRHEAASALAAWRYWLNRKERERMTALAVYLIAAHHGKVRTVLRATKGANDVFGIMQGDTLPSLPGWWSENTLEMDLRPKIFGMPGEWVNDELYKQSMPSWIGMTTELLGKILPSDSGIIGNIPDGEPKNIGPLSLAFLEVLVIAADGRASQKLGNGESL